MMPDNLLSTIVSVSICFENMVVFFGWLYLLMNSLTRSYLLTIKLVFCVLILIIQCIVTTNVQHQKSFKNLQCK